MSASRPVGRTAEGRGSVFGCGAGAGGPGNTVEPQLPTDGVERRVKTTHRIDGPEAEARRQRLQEKPKVKMMGDMAQFTGWEPRGTWGCRWSCTTMLHPVAASPGGVVTINPAFGVLLQL